MSNAIQLQADIGGVGIRGLGAFSSVLSTLSADNVTPMAMVQMENLGALFHINGKFAEQVPDKLKRFSLQPLGRIAISVGWRRGDSASLMADSSGGQAIALLSLCLINLFSYDKVALILHRASSRVLPNTVNVSSMAQLLDVAKILAGKLQAFGFGNYLAQQIMKVNSVYEQLGVRIGEGLLTPLTEEAMVDLLDSLQRIYSENNAVLRITGIEGMGYILALVLFMFPNDVLVTAESFILHEGSSAKKHIIVELSQVAGGSIKSQVETELKLEPFVELPVTRLYDALIYPFYCHRFSFAWNGWMASYLQLSLSGFGATCTEELLIATCDLLITVAPEISNEPPDERSSDLPRVGLNALLGEYPMLRMERTCEEILLVRPSATRMTVLSCFGRVASIFTDILKDTECPCTVRCEFKMGWMDDYLESVICPRRRLWRLYGHSLEAGFYSFLINAGPNTSFSPQTNRNMTNIVNFVNEALGTPKLKTFYKFWRLYGRILVLFGGADSNLAQCSRSTTIFASVLRSLQIPTSLLRTFELVDGQLVYNGRYYTSLSQDSDNVNRNVAQKSILSMPKLVEPSNIGQHSHLSITVFETISGLTLKATAQCAGQILSFPLSSIVNALFELQATARCTHPSSKPLKKTLNRWVLITSVAAPRPEGRRIGIVMTKSNPTAQLLSCGVGVRGLLLRDCCLDCAFQQAKRGRFHTIIVT